MNVARFEGTLGGKVFLEANWLILEGSEKKEGVSQKSRITEPGRGTLEPGDRQGRPGPSRHFIRQITG